MGDSLSTAMAIMVLRGLQPTSRLPVLRPNGRLYGVVSRQSIGRAHGRRLGGLGGCHAQGAAEADRSDELLDWIGAVHQSGYVLVRDHDHKVRRLITAADPTVRFGTRVRPFVLVEEIEQRLRGGVDQRVPLDRRRAAVPRHRASRVRSAANPAFGAYGHLLRLRVRLRVPENRPALGWGIDQKSFLAALEECRDCHFRTA
nr:CBS domain-containing protein [Streptomyces fuscichromogenes]